MIVESTQILCISINPSRTNRKVVVIVMIKKFLAFTLIVTTIALSAFTAFAAEETLNNEELKNSYTLGVSSPEMKGVKKQLDLVLSSAQLLGATASTLSDDPSDFLSNAVSVYMYSQKDVVDLLSGNMSQNTFIDESKKIWRIPVGVNSLGNYVYSNVTLNNGDDDIPECIENIPGKSNVEYIFNRDLIDEILKDNQLNAQSITPISVQNIHTDFVQIVDEHGDSYFISFSVRPDFLKLENGQVYSPNEVLTALQDWMDRRKPSIAGGGGATGTSDYLLLSVVAISSIALGLLIFCILKKRIGAHKK